MSAPMNWPNDFDGAHATGASPAPIGTQPIRAAAMSMNEHSFDVTWRFVVPPENTQRIVITQRQDGPFRGNAIGGMYGHYYVSREEWVRGQWQHASGSSRGGFKSYAEAHRIAERVWEEAKGSRQWRA